MNKSSNWYQKKFFFNDCTLKNIEHLILMMLATMWTPLATFICKIYLVTSELLCLSCCYVCAVSVSWAGYLLESHFEKSSAKEWAMNSLIIITLDVWILLIFYFPIIANVLMHACMLRCNEYFKNLFPNVTLLLYTLCLW